MEPGKYGNSGGSDVETFGRDRPAEDRYVRRTHRREEMCGE